MPVAGVASPTAGQVPVHITIHAPITIYAAPGMDERRVAEQVRRALEETLRETAVRRRGALYD